MTRQALTTVLRKELRQYSATGMPYLVVAGFLVPAAVWFVWFYDFLGTDLASLRGYFAAFPVLYVVILPALTMRTWVEERRTGTLELLRSAPLSDRAIVLGKFAAVMCVVLCMLLLTAAVPLSVMRLGAFDFGAIAAEYIGAVLLAAASVAVAMAVSCRMRSQVSAYLGGLLVLLVLNAVHQLPLFVNLPGWPAEILRSVSLEHQFRGFARGVVDTGSVGYYLTLTAAMLYLAELRLARAEE